MPFPEEEENLLNRKEKSGPKTTLSNEEIERQLNDNVAPKNIARNAGLKLSAVYRRIEKYPNLKAALERLHQREKEIRIRHTIEDRATGDSLSKIGKRRGFSGQHAKRIERDAGLPARPRGNTTNHPRKT